MKWPFFMSHDGQGFSSWLLKELNPFNHQISGTEIIVYVKYTMMKKAGTGSIPKASAITSCGVLTYGENGQHNRLMTEVPGSIPRKRLLVKKVVFSKAPKNFDHHF